MADTDSLRLYKAAEPPTIPGGEQRYLAGELQRISQSIGSLVQAMKKIEARMNAHGI